MPRRIKPRKIPGFEYEGVPAIRRNRHRAESESENAGDRTPRNDRQEIPREDREDQREQSPQNQNQPVLNLAENERDEAEKRDKKKAERKPERNRAPHQELEDPNTNLSPANQNQTESLDDLLDKIYKYKKSPAAFSAAVQKYIDSNYSLSIHKQRRKKFL